MTIDEVIKKLEQLKVEAYKKSRKETFNHDDLYQHGKYVAYEDAIRLLEKVKEV